MLFDRSGWSAAAVGHVDVEAALALAYRVAASLPHGPQVLIRRA